MKRPPSPFSRSRLLRQGVPVLLLLLALAGCAMRREVEKRLIESAWRQFLAALAQDDAEGAYALFDKSGGTGTIDAFKESIWFDALHPWSLSVTNAAIQLVSAKPNLPLTRATVRSSTRLDPVWEPKPSGIYTEATLVKRGREWKVSGLPVAVAR